MAVDQLDEKARTRSIKSVLGLQGAGNQIVCPLPGHIHHNNTPSFSIYFSRGREQFVCFGNCGKTGDVIDLVGYLKFTDYDKSLRMRVEVAKYLEDNYAPEIVVAPTQGKKLAPDEWKKHLPPTEETIKYARTRGLNTETLRKFRIGSLKNFMTIPVFMDGELTSIKLRNILSDKERSQMSGWTAQRFISLKGSRAGIFNFDAVKYTLDPIVIVKGEIPCMLLDELGIMACAPTGGEGTRAQSYFEFLALAKRRVLIGDNDQVVRAAVRAEELRAQLRFPPKKYKDVDEWILDDQSAIETIGEWLWKD